MKVLIIEDEPRAANRLARLITQIDPTIEVLEKLPSVKASISWLQNNPGPDLIFMDVRLEDGDCFEIFDAVDLDSPIVFSTAYSEYAVRAFAVNSIDYLLKPVVKAPLIRALSKHKKLMGHKMTAWPDFNADKGKAAYQRQFLVAVAGRFIPVKIENVIAARSYLKSTQLIDKEGKQWLVDKPLSEVADCLDPLVFFQVSRQWLIKLSELMTLTRKGGQYFLQLSNLDELIKVSRSRVTPLKNALRVR